MLYIICNCFLYGLSMNIWQTTSTVAGENLDSFHSLDNTTDMIVERNLDKTVTPKNQHEALILCGIVICMVIFVNCLSQLMLHLRNVFQIHIFPIIFDDVW